MLGDSDLGMYSTKSKLSSSAPFRESSLINLGKHLQRALLPVDEITQSFATGIRKSENHGDWEHLNSHLWPLSNIGIFWPLSSLMSTMSVSSSMTGIMSSHFVPSALLLLHSRRWVNVLDWTRPLLFWGSYIFRKETTEKSRHLCKVTWNLFGEESEWGALATVKCTLQCITSLHRTSRHVIPWNDIL